MDKEKARAAAETLLEQERRRRGPIVVRRPPFFVRSKASSQVTPARERELYLQAYQNILGQRWASIALACSPVVILVGAWFFMRHPVNAGYAVAMQIGLVMPFGIATFHLRRELARLARADQS